MNNNYENLPAVLNANQLAAALGISRAGAYTLLRKYDIRYVAQRTREGKSLSLRWDGVR